MRIRCRLLDLLSLGACSNEVPEAAVVPLQGGVLKRWLWERRKWATFLSFGFLKKPKAGRCWSRRVSNKTFWTTVICNYARSRQVV